MSALQRLRELEAAAAPGPWRFLGYTRSEGDICGSGLSAIAERVKRDNAVLIISTRNLLPALLDIAEAASRVERWEHFDADYADWDTLHEHDADHTALRAALAALEDQEAT